MRSEVVDNSTALTKTMTKKSHLQDNAGNLQESLNHQHTTFYLTTETLLQHCSAFHASNYVTTRIKYGVCR